MQCHTHDNNESPTQQGNRSGTQESSLESHGATPSLPRRATWLSVLTLAGTLTVPHAVCFLGGNAVVVSIGAGITTLTGGYLVVNFCGHKELETSTVVPLLKLPKIPSQFKHLAGEAEADATQALLDALPVFHEVIAFKEREALEKEGGITPPPILVEFIMDDEGQIIAVFCKGGRFCECSKPEAYLVGRATDLDRPETYPGQHTILRAALTAFGRADNTPVDAQ
jgi:hypothetical protein